MEATIPLPVPSLSVGILILFFSLLFMGFLSSSEAALISVNKIRVREKAENGSKTAQAILKLLNNHDKLFGTILLSENLLIIFASSLSTAMALHYYGDGGIAIATGLSTLVVVMFGEIAPKTFAARNSDVWAHIVVYPIMIIYYIVSPLVIVMTAITNVLIQVIERVSGLHGKPKNPYITEDELKMLVNVSSDEGILEKEEQAMIHGIFEFKDTTAKEIMTPRTRVVAISNADTIREIYSLVLESGHSRLPVYHDTIDNIVGLFYIKDILPFFAASDISRDTVLPASYIRPIHVVPENKKIDDLFKELKKQKLQMAVVMDEYGGTAGIISLEDILEEIVGEIQDEYDIDEHAPIRHNPDGSLLVDPHLPLSEALHLIGYEPAEDEEMDYDTIGGYVFGVLGHLSNVNDSVMLGGAKLTVKSVDTRKHITSLQIELPKLEEEESAKTSSDKAAAH